MAKPPREIRVKLRHVANRPIQLRYFCPVKQDWTRISTGTYDEKKAEKQRRQLEAELLTGTHDRNTDCRWQVFRDAYDAEELSQLRDKSREHALGALNAVELILKPKFLSEVAGRDALTKFRNRLRRGDGSRFSRPRSPVTVNSYLTALLTALKWAGPDGKKWLAKVPKKPRVRGADKSRLMKGRPLSGEEFERMLEKVPVVVGDDVAESWRFLLNGLRDSALRLEEAMEMSWDIPHTIQPRWPRGKAPIILIPGDEQKNGDDEEIPMLPWLEERLKSVSEHERTGWVFNPQSTQGKLGRTVSQDRLSVTWVGKIIGRIGKAAGVVVLPAKPKEKIKAKFASAHDLRRTCEDRMEAAGVDPLTIARIMRHKSFETTMKHYRKANAQREAVAVRAKIAAHENRSHIESHHTENAT